MTSLNEQPSGSIPHFSLSFCISPVRHLITKVAALDYYPDVWGQSKNLGVFTLSPNIQELTEHING
jgi:hypothetical protein